MPDRHPLKRRAALAMGAAAAGGTIAELAGWMTASASAGQGSVPGALPGSSRADRAYRIRVEAARRQRQTSSSEPQGNGDEERHGPAVASFAKGLPHDALGHADPAAQAALLKALRSGSPDDFERVPLAGVARLANPQCSYAFSLEGADPHSFSMPPAPALAGPEQAGEACELYWQALTRDVPYGEYHTDPHVAAAASELSRLRSYNGPRPGMVTPASIFRGTTAGDLVGPYVSQFLWKEVPFGAIRLVQQVRTATPGLDYLTSWEDWLAVQNGGAASSRHAGTYRYVRSSRDLCAYVGLDFSYQPFLTAALILFGMEGTNDVRKPYKGAPFDAGNPYRRYQSQSTFATFGPPHALDLLARVAGAALRACWFQKWLVHRRLRPEEFGGRVHNHMTGSARYALHDDLLSSSVLERTRERHGGFLLPQAYPEGAPLHPAYPAGHAVVAGACATVLKAFFDESFPVDEPVVASRDSLSLSPYKGPQLTVGGELDKLASNVAIGRNAAGIHWRSDGQAGLRLGEEVALSVLADERECLNERFDGFELTRFDGTRIKA